MTEWVHFRYYYQRNKQGGAMKIVVEQMVVWFLAAFLGVAFWLGAVDIARYAAMVIG